MAEVWPSENEVKAGVVFGPNGDDYEGEYGLIPNTPLLLVEFLSATSLRATVSGDDGATHTLKLMQSGDANWTDAGSCVGDGVIDVEDLAPNATYILSAVSQLDDFTSAFTPVQTLTLTAPPSTAGFITTPVELLKATLAASASFRAWVGATGGTEEENIVAALTHIHEFGVSADAMVYPFATVGVSMNTAAALASVGFNNQLRPRASLKLTFDALVNSETYVDDETELKQFLQWVQAILVEMGQLAGTPGYLDMTGWGFDGEPRLTRPDMQEPEGDGGEDTAQTIVQLEINVEWGTYSS